MRSSAPKIIEGCSMHVRMPAMESIPARLGGVAARTVAHGRGAGKGTATGGRRGHAKAAWPKKHSGERGEERIQKTKVRFLRRSTGP